MSELSLRALYYGKDEPLPEVRILRAGPVSVLLEGGDIRYVRLGDREILRRVYVAVRDQNWDTIAGRIENLHVEQEADSFRVTFSCSHRQGEIDFVWRGTIGGDARGTITYAMDGETRSTFRRNRIGICILHPIAECAGAPFVAEKVDGSVELGTFPRYISPHQPAIDLRAISHEVRPGVRAEVRFTGDVFEMEDQRNWTDASFKTYSTPLRLPYPVEVAAGTRIAQAITVTLQSSATIVVSREPSDVHLQVGGEATVPLPRIGLGQASHGQPLTTREVERLRPLNLAHLRVDLRLADAGYPAVLGRAVADAQTLGVPLEIAVFVTDAAERELASLRTILGELEPAVAAWLIFHVGERSTSARWVDLASAHLRTYDARAPIGAGTNAYFTELNRERPPVSAIDFACYSLNPQVHAFDNRSLVETLPGQGWTVESARQFVGARPIAISPITLKPRFNPNATGASSEAAPDELPRSVDPRQMSLFGAAWTAGSLKYVAEAGATRVTYYETTGCRGLMELADGAPRSAAFPSLPGAVFPLYHVFAAIGEFAGGVVVPARSSAPLRVDGLAIRKRGQTRLILASYGPSSETVQLAGLAARVQVKRLDETNVVPAMTSPEEFRAAPAEDASMADGRLTLALRPYAVVTIDCEDG